MPPLYPRCRLELQLETKNPAEEMSVASTRREQDRIVEDLPEEIRGDPEVPGQKPIDPELFALAQVLDQ